MEESGVPGTKAAPRYLSFGVEFLFSLLSFDSIAGEHCYEDYFSLLSPCSLDPNVIGPYICYS